MNVDRQDLENFVLNNPELERLEGLLEEFNIFEVLGAVNVELRHSEFLAYLLNPNQNHGLGDHFVRRFLQRAVAAHPFEKQGLSAIDLDVLDFEDLVVMREWGNIDILLLNEIEEFVVIIENKIGSIEHSNQLARYYQQVERQHPGQKILALYLTPDGDDPSDDRYLPVSYQLLSDLLAQAISNRASTIGSEVLTLMEHYVKMLRRHILSSSELDKLAKKIYHKHQKALDFIFEHRPDIQTAIFEFLQELVRKHRDLTLDHTTKSYIRFIPKRLDTMVFKQGEGWTPTGRILLFEFKNASNRLGLYLTIGPGPRDIRERIYELGDGSHLPLKKNRGLGESHHTLYKRDILSSKDYVDSDFTELEKKIQNSWEKFLLSDLPEIVDALENEDWIFQEPDRGT